MNAQTMQADRLVADNIRIHDRITRNYEKDHGEFFNDIEQERLQAALRRAAALVQSGNRPLECLDFGCGSGNVSRHLLTLDAKVTAADVSAGFLDLVRSRYPDARLRTLHLPEGRTSGVPDESLDLIATYSVLHHIPDYLAACRELARMCRKGGVVYIDHEATEEFWDGDPVYAAFQKEALRFDWRKYLTPSNYLHRLRRILDPRHSNEGDIHVWPDDHIEWRKVVELMGSMGFDTVLDESYLLNRRLYRPDVYHRYAGRCCDTKLMAFRKRAA
jgi:ubiquinone/menaquinone biosynthesis C-methylase UbiE